jgi:hypothetical protein
MYPFKIPYDTMDRPPVAIYLSKRRRYDSYMTCALAFQGHRQVLKVMGRPSNLFFTHCKPCVAYMDGSCPGGNRWLNASDYVSSHTINHPIAGRVSVAHPSRQCVKQFGSEPRPSLEKQELTIETFIPDYLIASGYGSHNLDNSTYHLFCLEQKMIDENDPESLWKLSPLRFPNTYTNGEVCRGRNRIGDGNDFGLLQRTVFNTIYNSDLFDETMFGSRSPADYLQDLLAGGFDKMEGALERTHGNGSNWRRGDAKWLTGSASDIVKRILPPIFTRIHLDAGKVYLTDKSGAVFTIEADLSGPITPVES